MSAFRRARASDYVAAYREGRTTPSEVVERTLEAVRQSQASQSPSLGAFVALDEARVRAEAEAATARYRDGAPLGPLDGVPIAIKDEFDLAGYRTTVGAAWRRHAAPATKDSEVAARLGAAGAIRFGKAAMHEVGLGGTGINPHYGTPRNPYAPERLPGGSSSGSAVAVSAGLVPLALGSDAGGSIRIPAALCGVAGIKPTYGRIPGTGGSLLAWSLDHLGPLGASAADLHAFLEATWGPDGRDPAACAQPAPGPLEALDAQDLSGLRLCYCPTFGMDGDPAVVAAFQATISQLRERGAQVETVELRWREQIQPVGYLTLCTEGAASQREALARHKSAFGGDVRLILSVGGRVTAVEYLHAQRIRRAIRDEFCALLDGDFDAFLNPTCAAPATVIRADAEKHGELDDAVNGPLSAYTFAGNLTGLPAVSVPVGTVPGSDGSALPVGVQLMGPAWSESRLLSMAAALEAISPMPRPRVYFEPLAG